MLHTFRVRELKGTGNIQEGLAEEGRSQRMDVVERGSWGWGGHVGGTLSGGLMNQNREKQRRVESSNKASVTRAQDFLGRGGRWVKADDRELLVLRKTRLTHQSRRVFYKLCQVPGK